MSFMIIEMEYDYHLVECPAYIADNPLKYQRQFYEWLNDRTNDHGYWGRFEPESYFIQNGIPDPYDRRDPDGKDFLAYNEAAFVDWLNRFELREKPEKARIVKSTRIGERDKWGLAKLPDRYEYPRIGF